MLQLENKYYTTKRNIDKVAYKKQKNLVDSIKKNDHALIKI